MCNILETYIVDVVPVSKHYTQQFHVIDKYTISNKLLVKGTRNNLRRLRLIGRLIGGAEMVFQDNLNESESCPIYLRVAEETKVELSTDTRDIKIVLNKAEVKCVI